MVWSPSAICSICAGFLRISGRAEPRGALTRALGGRRTACTGERHPRDHDRGVPACCCSVTRFSIVAAAATAQPSYATVVLAADSPWLSFHSDPPRGSERSHQARPLRNATVSSGSGRTV
jgi:hypothetical protein